MNRNGYNLDVRIPVPSHVTLSGIGVWLQSVFLLKMFFFLIELSPIVAPPRTSMCHELREICMARGQTAHSHQPPASRPAATINTTYIGREAANIETEGHGTLCFAMQPSSAPVQLTQQLQQYSYSTDRSVATDRLSFT